MAGLNKVLLIGYLGRDPEVRVTPSGSKVCSLRLATTEVWRDKATGEKKERTEWHSIAVYSENLISVAQQYLRKGSKVYVEGQLETRKRQDPSGGERQYTDVVVRNFGTILMLDSRGSGVGVDAMPDAEGGASASGFDDIPF